MSGLFLPPNTKEMELYQRLVEIFEISTINIDKANRRTLLRYAKRVQFQKRREIFYSVCSEGKKSKVAICKTDERPHWVHNLATLQTKALRHQLKTILKELGASTVPKKANLQKLAKEKNWEAVVKLQDEAKTGGMLCHQLAHNIRSQSTLPPDPVRASRAREMLREASRRVSSTPVRLRRRGSREPASGPRYSRARGVSRRSLSRSKSRSMSPSSRAFMGDENNSRDD